MIVKLVEETEDNVVVLLYGKEVPMDKEAFKMSFEKIGPGVYQAKDDFLSSINDRLEDIRRMIPTIATLNANPGNEDMMRRLGEHVMEYSTRWKVSHEEAMAEIHAIYSKFVEHLTESRKQDPPPDKKVVH